MFSSLCLVSGNLLILGFKIIDKKVDQNKNKEEFPIECDNLVNGNPKNVENNPTVLKILKRVIFFKF